MLKTSSLCQRWQPLLLTGSSSPFVAAKACASSSRYLNVARNSAQCPGTHSTMTKVTLSRHFSNIHRRLRGPASRPRAKKTTSTGEEFKTLMPHSGWQIPVREQSKPRMPKGWHQIKNHKSIKIPITAESELYIAYTRLSKALYYLDRPDDVWAAYVAIQGEDHGNWLNHMPLGTFQVLVSYFHLAPAAIPDVWERRKEQLRMAPRVVAIFRDWHKLGLNLNAYNTATLMASLNRLGQWEESLAMMDRLQVSEGTIDSVVLNHAVRAWIGLQKTDQALKLVNDPQFEPSEYTLGHVTQHLLATQQREAALEIWNRLTTIGLENILVVNNILRECVNQRDNEFCQMVFKQATDLGVEPDLESFSLMLGMAVMDAKGPYDRDTILQGVSQKIEATPNSKLDRGLLESTLIAFSKKGDMEGAVLVFRLMLKNAIPPSIHDYNNILRGFLQNQSLISKALDWVQAMRLDGIRPNLETYGRLMTAFSLKRSPRETEETFIQCIRDGLTPTMGICNSMLLAYEQARMNRRCFQLYLSMWDQGIRMDRATFSTIFNAMFHHDKAAMEGFEGKDSRGGSDSWVDLDVREKLSAPIGKTRIPQTPQEIPSQQIAPEREESQEMTESSKAKRFIKGRRHMSHTTLDHLSPRTVFRDMIILRISPSSLLYANILRTFLASRDFVGGFVALRTMADHHLLTPTPMIHAIVIGGLLKELDSTGAKEETLANFRVELIKLARTMSRRRGLIDMMARMVLLQSGIDPSQSISQESRMIGSALFESSMNPGYLKVTAPDHRQLPRRLSISQRQVLLQKAATEETKSPSPLLKVIRDAKEMMGGDIVDLFQPLRTSGSMEGSGLSPKVIRRKQLEASSSNDGRLDGGAEVSTSKATTNIPLDEEDFEHWFRQYSITPPKRERWKSAGMVFEEVTHDVA